MTSLEKKGCWKSLAKALVELDITDPDKFRDESYVQDIVTKLSERDFKTGKIRSCSEETPGYEFTIGVKDLAYLTATVGPDLMNIPEFKRLVKIYRKVSDFEEYQVDIIHN